MTHSLLLHTEPLPPIPLISTVIAWWVLTRIFCHSTKSTTHDFKVVINFDDGTSSYSGWSPQPAQVTIQFRGVQASYTFPVGLTT